MPPRESITGLYTRPHGSDYVVYILSITDKYMYHYRRNKRNFRCADKNGDMLNALDELNLIKYTFFAS